MTLKRLPEDFVVEELLSPSAKAEITSRPAALGLYRLTKANLTTPQATAELARALGVAPGGVQHAGLKDRHAKTTQYVTARCPRGKSLPEASGDGWRAQRLGYISRSLCAADIEANRFEIVIRDLAAESSQTIDRLAESLDCGQPGPAERTLLFVNYFGDQRFGSARHGEGFLARHLVRGEFEQALRLAIGTADRKDAKKQKEFKRTLAEYWGRWPEAVEKLPRCPERAAVECLAAGGDFRQAFASLPYLLQQISVQAYQSFLWNAIAAKFLAKKLADESMRMADPFGEMIFPRAVSVPTDLRDLELPMLGKDSALLEPWRATAEAILAQEGLRVADLAIPGLRRPIFAETPRKLFAWARRLALSPAQADELAPGKLKRKAAFELPSGSYATVLLRALGQ